jgi:hypothetical protein
MVNRGGNSLKYIRDMVISKLFSARMLFIIIVLFITHDVDVKVIYELAQQYDVKVVPVLLPFLLGSLEFVLVYGLCIVYFFSDVPFMNNWEMLYINRTGRKKWCACKITYIFICAVLYTVINYLIDFVRMLPHVTIGNKWDKLAYSLAYGAIDVDDGTIYSKYMVEFRTPLFCFTYTFIMSVAVVFVVAMSMFAISLMINREVAVLLGCVIAFMPVVVKNSRILLKYIYFVSPLNWLTEIRDSIAILIPTELYMALFLGVLLIVDVAIIFVFVRKKDYVWMREA